MKKIYGPYLRKDGRQHLVIVEDGKKTTISYPKWLMENHLGRKLEAWETIDHLDENPLNNAISNLEVVSRSENASRYKKNHPAEYLTLVCKHCGKEFTKRKKEEIYDRAVRKKDGPFCSKSCVGKVHH